MCLRKVIDINITKRLHVVFTIGCLQYFLFVLRVEIMKILKIMLLCSLSIPLIALTGCKSIPPYSNEYAQARLDTQGISLDQEKAEQIGQRFTQTFNHLGTSAFLTQASALYADELFINDTLSQFSQRSKLLEHFTGMNKRVSHAKVELLNTSYSQDSAYVHWHMRYDLHFFGTKRTMNSFGISEIKINKDHKIIFQQDFWDPANGLYRSLPYVSGAYAWVLPFKK